MLKSFLQYIGTALLAGIVLALLAPLGTHNFEAGERFLFWVGLCLAGGFGASSVEFILKYRDKTLPLWLKTLLQSFGATLLVALFMFAFFPMADNARWVSIGYIWLISIVICTIGALAHMAGKAKNAPVQGQERPAILDRLSPKFRDATLYAIASEDHYVRFYTSKGEEMILMRLSDAIKETAPLPGLSPHRSWWVAEAGVETVRRVDGKAVITLKSGQTVPVSRGKVKDVKAAGWLG